MNLQENINRIKEVMGLNEGPINLDTDNDDSPILEDIHRVGTSNDGDPIISMKINTFVRSGGKLVPNPYNSSEKENIEGESIKIEIILEWEPYRHHKHAAYKEFPFTSKQYDILPAFLGGNNLQTQYFIKSIVDIKSDVKLDKKLIDNIKELSKPPKSVKHFVQGLYGPHIMHYGVKNRDVSSYYDPKSKTMTNVKKNEEEIITALKGETEQQTKPKIEDVPGPDKQGPKDKGSMWTSTSSR